MASAHFAQGRGYSMLGVVGEGSSCSGNPSQTFAQFLESLRPLPMRIFRSVCVWMPKCPACCGTAVEHGAAAMEHGAVLSYFSKSRLIKIGLGQNERRLLKELIS